MTQALSTLRLTVQVRWWPKHLARGTSDPRVVQQRKMSRPEPSAGLVVIRHAGQAVTGKGERNACDADCPL